MVGGQIPTAAANSRLAALQARKKPQVDVSSTGIAIQSGGGASPLLTNRVEALSDDALAGVSQRGFSSGREAIGAAMDAGGRTFRTGLLNEELTRQREQREVDYALAEEDALAEARRGTAIGALKARSEADLYFDPAISRMRDDQTQTKMGLYEAQTAGTRAKAAADLGAAKLKANADVQGARLGAGARALQTFDEIRSGLTPADPAVPGWFGTDFGATPAAENDQANIDALDDRTLALIDSLGLTPQDVGADPADAAPDDERVQAITLFSQKHGITPEQAEAILVKRGIIP